MERWIHSYYESVGADGMFLIIFKNQGIKNIIMLDNIHFQSILHW